MLQSLGVIVEGDGSRLRSLVSERAPSCTVGRCQKGKVVHSSRELFGMHCFTVSSRLHMSSEDHTKESNERQEYKHTLSTKPSRALLHGAIWAPCYPRWVQRCSKIPASHHGLKTRAQSSGYSCQYRCRYGDFCCLYSCLPPPS